MQPGAQEEILRLMQAAQQQHDEQHKLQQLAAQQQSLYSMPLQQQGFPTTVLPAQQTAAPLSDAVKTLLSNLGALNPGGSSAGTVLDPSSFSAGPLLNPIRNLAAVGSSPRGFKPRSSFSPAGVSQPGPFSSGGLSHKRSADAAGLEQPGWRRQQRPGPGPVTPLAAAAAAAAAAASAAAADGGGGGGQLLAGGPPAAAATAAGLGQGLGSPLASPTGAAAAAMRALGLPVDADKASMIDHMFVLLQQRGLSSNEQVGGAVRCASRASRKEWVGMCCQRRPDVRPCPCCCWLRAVKTGECRGESVHS